MSNYGYQNPSTESQSAAIAAIHGAHGHFVLCRNDKTPLWKGWPSRRPGLSTVLDHTGPVGLIPWSISASALDVDCGPYQALPAAWAVYESRRAGGAHVWYRDSEPRGNASFHALGCAGELRSGKGYLVLHPGAADLLAAAIELPRQGSPFPADLLHYGPVIPPARSRPAAGRGQAAVNFELELVFPGARRRSLFHVVSPWLSAQAVGSDRAAWFGRVEAETLRHNKRFPVPLPQSQALDLAAYMAEWRWSGGGGNWFSQEQARRGRLSAAARRKGTPLEHDREPWEALGISRKTWYRDRRLLATELQQ